MPPNRKSTTTRRLHQRQTIQNASSRNRSARFFFYATPPKTFFLFSPFSQDFPQAVRSGAIEELSVDEVAANVWNACNVSRNSARTIINGDYFESQPETFQREWVGEKRFELWKSGKLNFEDLAKPATSYRATTADLTPPTKKSKDIAASDDKTDKAPATIPSVEEIRKFTDDAEQSFDDEIAVAELWNARAQEAEEAGELENAAKFREKAAVLWAPITRKLNQLALDKFFPIDAPNSANRKTTTAKTPGRVQTPAPRGFSLLGPRKKYRLTETSKKELGEIEKALDFVGA